VSEPLDVGPLDGLQGLLDEYVKTMGADLFPPQTPEVRARWARLRMAKKKRDRRMALLNPIAVGLPILRRRVHNYVHRNCGDW
jgi:hypothetical protein